MGKPADRAICHIGFGSNLGDRAANCRQALKALGRLPKTEIMAISSLYETEPVCSEGPWFLNGVMRLSTGLSPEELLKGCLEIEAWLGRIRPGPPASPRVMDLDILLYGEQVLNTPDLVVPHPRMHERGFVLIPLAEIAPNCRDPVSKKYISEVLAQLKDTHVVKRIAPAHALYQHGGS